MQLAGNLWVEGAYYLDVDELGQLRIVGPNNHLHFGSVGLYSSQFKIDLVYTQVDRLVVSGRLLASEFFLHDPALGHIRKVRELVKQPGKPPRPFEDIVKQHSTEVAPNYIGLRNTKNGQEVTYKRLYQSHWYGVVIQLTPDVKVVRHDRRRGFKLTSSQPEINFVITADTDNLPKNKLGVVTQVDPPIDTKFFGPQKHQIDFLLDRTALEINHLVKNNKTSGYDYGTVFPRDWMESADLGAGDLTPEAVRYMYEKAFEFIDTHGVGWHENIVGEYEFEKRRESSELSESLDNLVDRSSRIGSALQQLIGQVEHMYVIRNMIDIEPRYILGMQQIDAKDLGAQQIERLRRVASYIMMQAEINDLITFKKIPPLLRRHKGEEYYRAGDWRDSSSAYKLVHPVIAPYDVNVVFYPQALRLLVKHHQLLQVDKSMADKLLKKWERVKDWYRFENSDGTAAMSLALYDIKKNGDQLQYRKLTVNHTDEAYDFFYGQPSESEAVSFSKRLLSPDYFYTPSGPVVVGNLEPGYDTRNYHGRVIWSKQTAIAAVGLQRALKGSKGWSEQSKSIVQKALLSICQTSIDAFIKLGEAPELHYDLDGQPHLYSDQPDAEGPMNRVQLWSAVGARRIIKTYLEVCDGF